MKDILEPYLSPLISCNRSIKTLSLRLYVHICKSPHWFAISVLGALCYLVSLLLYPTIQCTGRYPETKIHLDTAVGNFSNTKGAPSDKWRPLLVSSCEGLHSRSAPCLQEHQNGSNIIGAQEVIYMPFTLKLPSFINESQRKEWINATKVSNFRAILEDSKDFAVYSTQYGQNLVFKNTGYFGNPKADIWSDTSCMGQSVPHVQFLDEKNSSDAHEAILLATSPDSWSWQHFLDRVTTLWAQAMLIMNQEDISKVEIVSGNRPGQVVNELYDLLGVKHLHQVEQIEAKRLFFSCRTPLIHPFNIQKINEILGVKSYPPHQRKVVLMMSRDDENLQRHILNQNELDTRVTSLLESRNKGEVFVPFKLNEFNKVEDIIKYISANVKMIISPHGGALLNARFASSSTAILEFMPRGRYRSVFWEQTHTLDQDYHVYFLDSLDASHNMKLDNLDEVIAWIDSILDSIDSQKPPRVIPQYQWNV